MYTSSVLLLVAAVVVVIVVDHTFRTECVRMALEVATVEDENMMWPKDDAAAAVFVDALAEVEAVVSCLLPGREEEVVAVMVNAPVVAAAALPP